MESVFHTVKAVHIQNVQKHTTNQKIHERAFEKLQRTEIMTPNEALLIIDPKNCTLTK